MCNGGGVAIDALQSFQLCWGGPLTWVGPLTCELRYIVIKEELYRYSKSIEFTIESLVRLSYYY
jgi:hypothetical protein